MKTEQREHNDKKGLTTLDLKLFKSLLKGKHYAAKAFQSLPKQEKKLSNILITSKSGVRKSNSLLE